MSGSKLCFPYTGFLSQHCRKGKPDNRKVIISWLLRLPVYIIPFLPKITRTCYSITVFFLGRKADNFGQQKGFLK